MTNKHKLRKFAIELYNLIFDIDKYWGRNQGNIYKNIKISICNLLLLSFVISLDFIENYCCLILYFTVVFSSFLIGAYIIFKVSQIVGVHIQKDLSIIATGMSNISVTLAFFVRAFAIKLLFFFCKKDISIHYAIVFFNFFVFLFILDSCRKFNILISHVSEFDGRESIDIKNVSHFLLTGLFIIIWSFIILFKTYINYIAYM